VWEWVHQASGSKSDKTSRCANLLMWLASDDALQTWPVAKTAMHVSHVATLLNLFLHFYSGHCSLYLAV
jgi:hypothetical protein